MSEAGEGLGKRGMWYSPAPPREYEYRSECEWGSPQKNDSRSEMVLTQKNNGHGIPRNPLIFYWWRLESPANPSLPNPLFSRENTGEIYVFWGQNRKKSPDLPVVKEFLEFSSKIGAGNYQGSVERLYLYAFLQILT